MYKSFDEIQPHNNQLSPKSMDYLIQMITGKPNLNDNNTLDIINEAMYHYDGTVADALVETIYNKYSQ
jgi:hypothetical protein